MTSLPAQSIEAPRYARFSRRLKGMFVDWTLALVVIFSALIIASSTRDDMVARTMGIAVVAILILFEPIMVSFTGGSVGHHFVKVRVVDDAHGGNVSFLKALARHAIKSLLGLYSFVLMAFTRRSQAVHDLMTRSTVQTREPA